SESTVTRTGQLHCTGTAGETQTISVDINTDDVDKDNENFTDTLGAISGPTATQAASITTGATGTGTIDNDDTATLSIDSPEVTEGTGGTSPMTFTVTLDHAVHGGFDVDFSALDGSADSSDYTVTTTGPLHFNGT